MQGNAKVEPILFVDGSPSLQPAERKTDGNVQGMIDSDLALEISAVKQ